MATTRLIPLHIGKGKTAGTAISNIIGYVKNPEKTEGGQLITSWQCDSRIADAEFAFAKRLYLQKTGRERGADDVIAYHLRQSFVPGEITPEEANRLGCELARRFTKGSNAYIVCTHTDKHHIHNHIIINSTSVTHDRKLRNFWHSAQAVRRLSDTICLENGYSVIENPKQHGKRYDQWLGENKKPSHREQIRRTIDAALQKNPKTFDELLQLLSQAGYTVKPGKIPSLLGHGQQRSIRMDTLGEGYTPDELRAVLCGKAAHTPRAPRSTFTKSEAAAGSLLIDIQSKLQQGKGVGYERWAKKFNLKQMAQTVAYLQEHGLTDYSDLVKKADESAHEVHVLSVKMKSAEARMEELGTLRKHIINYMKTRDTYTAYRKAGYSKKFFSEHQDDILLHKAAKQYFDTLGDTKLPSVKSINEEYAALSAEKKTLYAEYRSRREKMKELMIARANVESILGKSREEKSSPER